MSTSSSIANATLIDATSLFDACAVIAERFGRKEVKIDYSRLKQWLDQIRGAHAWAPADTTSVMVAVDPASEGQQRFSAMLSHAGYNVDPVHFRDAFISLPPGRSPNDSAARSSASFATRIAYVAGLMARHSSPSLLIVSHAYELCGPLVDLARRLPDAKLGVAFFGSLMDYRWKLSGNLSEAEAVVAPTPPRRASAIPLRVHSLAKDLGVSSIDVINRCAREGIQLQNHMSTISAALETTIREWFNARTHEASTQLGNARFSIRSQGERTWNGGIQFFNLEAVGPEIIGMDILGRVPQSTGVRSGLAHF